MRTLGITGKLVFGAACVVIGLGIAVTAHSVMQLEQLLRQEMAERVEAQALNWIEANYTQITVSGDTSTLQRAVNDLCKKSWIAYVVLEGIEGKQKAAAGLPQGLSQRHPAVNEATGRSWTELRDARGLRYFDLTMRIPSTGTGMNKDLQEMFNVAAQAGGGAIFAGSMSLGQLRMGVDRREFESRLNALVRRNITLALALTLLAVMASWFLAKRMIVPITDMRRVANKIAAGDLSERVGSGTDLQDEIGELVRNFNQMAERLKQNRDEMNLFYAGLEEKVRERTLELQEANRKLEHRDRLKSESLSTVSHELRTPLTSIKAHAEILLDANNPTPKEVRESLAIIDECTDRLTRLISDLLDLRTIESGIHWRMHRTDLREIVWESARLLNPHATARGILLRVHPMDSQPVYVDSDHIQRVITNLIGNAIKFCSPGQHVEVGCARVTNSGPHRAQAGQYVRISIADNGPGIPAEERERIFEAFYRVERTISPTSGTGLGLAISHEIVRRHEGEIWVDSKFGAGSTFYFTLPLSKAHGSSNRTDDDSDQVVGNSMRGDARDAQENIGM